MEIRTKLRELEAGPSRRTLWFAVFGAPAAWSVDEIASTYLHEGSCARLLGSPGTARIALVVLGLLMGAVAAFALVSAWRAMQALGRDTGEGGTIPDRRSFMAHAGVILGSLFTFGIVLRFLTVFFVVPCRYP